MPPKVRHYFEPWTAKRAPVKPPTAPLVPDDPLSVQVHDSYDRSVRDADWIVWGSGMGEPCVCTSLLGEPSVMDDRRIIVKVGKLVTDRDDAPGREAFARRIVACVNACEGLIDPERAVGETRQLLLDALQGRPIEPIRVVRCLALLSPADGYTRDRPSPFPTEDSS